MIPFHVFQMVLLVLLVCAVMAPMPGCWRICRRAGWPGWMSLLIVIPVVNAVAVFLFVNSSPSRFNAALRRNVEPSSTLHLPVHH
jgi:hypothetical protein